MYIKDKFSNFKDRPYRQCQEEALRFVAEDSRRVSVISAPTGSGKSLTGMCAGASYPKFLYLCSTKELQAQLEEDFPEAQVMMGRRNFACNLHPDMTADHCTHTQTTPCGLKRTCRYEAQKRKVLASSIAILNYHYFITEANFVGGFSGQPFIVCDEADTLESLLTDFIELNISRSRLTSLELSPPRYKTATAKDGLSSWREWAEKEAAPKVSSRLQSAKMRLENLGNNPPRFVLMRVTEDVKSLETLSRKLDLFLEHVDSTWIFQETATGWTFQPVWLTPELSERYFFRHGERYLLMSATMPPKHVLAQTLGLPVGDIATLELASTFQVESRPVILRPVADLSYKNNSADYPKLLREIEAILKKHEGQKGVIHTVSYELNKLVMSLGDPRLITHENAQDKEDALKKFSFSLDGVFVSPSSTRGLDLPDDECRFIIIAKCPFQDLSDKLVSSRVYSAGGLGKFWYRAMCAQSIVQASGRGVRHRGDWCVTYLLDKQIAKLMVENPGLFPAYWRDAIEF